MTTATPIGAKRGSMSRAERAALSDEKLIQATLDLIIESGVDTVTLRAIGERAGYSRGLVNYRFGTKDALLKEAVRRLMRGWAERVMQDDAAADTHASGSTSSSSDATDASEPSDAPSRATGLEAVRRYVLRHCKVVGAASHEFLAYTRLVHASLAGMPEIREDVVTVQNDVMQRIANWIQEGKDAGEIRPDIDADTEATWIYGAARGIGYLWMIDSDGVPLERSYTVLADAVVRNLAAD